MNARIRRAMTVLVAAIVLSSLARTAPAGPLADRRRFLNMLADNRHAATVEVAAHRTPTPPKPKKPPPKPKKPPSGGGHSTHATPHLPKQPVHVLHP